MVDSRTCQGVSKSGSPMPRLMTSFIVVTMSKKSRMPERGMSRTARLRRLRSDGEPFIGLSLVHEDPKAFVGLEHEMGRGGEHPFERGQPVAHKCRHLPQVLALHEEQQVVGPAHQ